MDIIIHSANYYIIATPFPENANGYSSLDSPLRAGEAGRAGHGVTHAWAIFLSWAVSTHTSSNVSDARIQSTAWIRIRIQYVSDTRYRTPSLEYPCIIVIRTCTCNRAISVSLFDRVQPQNVTTC
jgi:hypothetical protein